MTELWNWTASYPGLFAVCAMSGFAFPLPEDVPLLYAGIRVAGGGFEWGPALGAAMMGVFVRDLLVYGAGRCVGDYLLEKPWLHRLIPKRKLDRARQLVHDHGAAAVMAGRFMVGLRAPVFFVAGTAGVGRRQFILWDLLGILFAVPAVVILGYLLGPALVDTAVSVVRSGPLVWGSLAMVVGGSAWWFTRNKPSDGCQVTSRRCEPSPASDSSITSSSSMSSSGKNRT